MDNGLTTEWQASNIYCVKARYDAEEKRWKVDEVGTRELREAKRKERLSRGVPVKKWWQRYRQRLMDRDMDDKILEMYQSSMRLSEAFTQEFKDFWALPDDFNLDRFGICASSGSACTSGSLEPSHVLRAMGVPFTAAHGSIRFSLSVYNSEEDVDYIIEHLPEIIANLRAMSPFWEEAMKKEGS